MPEYCRECVILVFFKISIDNGKLESTLILKMVDNVTGIYPTGVLPQSMRLPAPVILSYRLDEVISGGLLSYSFENSSDVQGNVHIRTDVQLSGPNKAVYDVFFPIDQYISLRVHR